MITKDLLHSNRFSGRQSNWGHYRGVGIIRNTTEYSSCIL